MNPGRPRVFIGSSTEGKSVAEALQLGLDHDTEPTIWNQSVFALSHGTLEDLARASRTFDFAVLILTPDDLVERRGSVEGSPRDNVIFELGLFVGALGRDRTFIVYPRDNRPQLPSDLSGITAATYGGRADGDLEAALGGACTQIKKAIGRVLERPSPPSGPRKARLRSIARPYDTNVHRARARIVVIDDEPFKHAEFLRHGGFSIDELRDVTDIGVLADYSIVICDIVGVGTAFGDLGGAYLLKRIRERYPDIYLVAFSAYPYAPRFATFLRNADKIIRKDYPEEDWAKDLDATIASIIDPAARWKKLRQSLLEQDWELDAVSALEQAFIKAVQQQSQRLDLDGLRLDIGPEQSGAIVLRLNELLRHLWCLHHQREAKP
jgi:predicted nucleotide-binding protein with TIR-like domain